MRICPFCGQPAQTKEHVWPQWLRKYVPYILMSLGRNGRRFQQTEYVPHRGALVSRQQHIAEFLPDVVADVCRDCNSGWMAMMEGEVKALLGPAMDVSPGRTIDSARILNPYYVATESASSVQPLPLLTKANQTLLAAWFSKCVYAYSVATTSELNRPWTLEQFAALRNRKMPLNGARVWMGRSKGLYSDIVLSLAPIQMISLEREATIDPGRPRMASAWLSANGFVFFGIWMPVDMRRAKLPERLAYPHLTGLRRIWPPSSSGNWSDKLVSDNDAQALINLLPGIRDREGIPIEELSPAKIRSIKSAMLREAKREGFDPPYAIVQRRINERPTTDLIEGEMSPWPRRPL